MDSSVMVLLKFGELTAVERLSKLSSFAALIQFVCKRWDTLNKEMMSLSYVLPGNPFCILENEDDFFNMILMVGHSSVQSLEIHLKQVLSLDYYESSSSAISTTTSSHEFDLNFFHEQTKDLKSAKWVTAIDSVGQVFEGGISQFRNTLCKYATAVGSDFVYVKNDSDRITAKCKHKEERGCPWRIHTSIEPANGFAYIRSFERNHTCGDIYNFGSSSKISSDVLCDIILDDIRAKPSMGPSDVLKLLKSDYGIGLTYKVAFRGVAKAKDIVFGEADLSYDRLGPYFQKMKQVDPSSHFVLDYDSESYQFNRCFVSFGACITGFRHCRPMLFIDGTHLHGKYKGNMLAATAKDGNSGLFNVAFAIVSSEDTDNWTWFLQQLEPLVRGIVITFVSDRHQGILSSVKKVMPHCYHSFCLGHLRNNLRDKMKGCSINLRKKMVSLLYQCALAPTKEIFHTLLDQMKSEGGPKVRDFIANLPHVNYANAYFPGKRYGEMTSNAAESFNSQFREARSLPVRELIDQIRIKLMAQMCKRRVDSSKWTSVLCPNMDKKFRENLERVKGLVIIPSSSKKFQVCSSPTMVVNIEDRTCSCGKWQHEGFPCVHAAAVLYSSKINSFKYIETYFHSSKYRECYALAIEPYFSFSAQPTDDDPFINPPIVKRPQGRPKMRRIPSKGEVVFKRQMKCGRCGKLGNHNKKTCKEPM